MVEIKNKNVGMGDKNKISEDVWVLVVVKFASLSLGPKCGFIGCVV